MSQKQLLSALDNLSSIARKVYEYVPIGEPWTATQINSEVHRRTGSRLDHVILLGCLRSLVDSRLITEPQSLSFVRVQMKGRPILKTVAPVEVKAEVPSAPSDPIELLGALSDKLRSVADEIDATALAIVASMSKGEEELKKLRQLQQILKSLG